MNNLFISFIVLLVFILASRFINDRANRKLEPQKKADLVDIVSKNRIYSYVAIALIVLLYFVSIKFEIFSNYMIWVGYIILVLGLLILNGVRYYKKLKKNDFPDTYLKSFALSTVIRLIGFVVFIALYIFLLWNTTNKV